MSSELERLAEILLERAEEYRKPFENNSVGFSSSASYPIATVLTKVAFGIRRAAKETKASNDHPPQ